MNNTKSTLTVVIGDATRPKIEKIKDFKTSFFQDSYQKAFTLVSDIVSNFNEEKDENTRNDYYQQIRNNIIAFAGDRGSGKTSCLQTVYQVLGCYDNTSLKYIVDLFENEFKEKIRKNFDDVTFQTLPTIDPSYFEENSNILEIVLANMFSTFKEHASKTQASNNNESYLEKKRNLVTCFQKAKDTLDTINNEEIKSSNDSIEKLSALSAGINMKQQMTDLVEKYLEYFEKNDYINKRNHKILLIAIDDMDIQTEHAFKMVEQIRKYLIIKNVIILVGVKLTQLTDIIKQAYYENYKTIIDKQSLSDTVEDMAGRYMSKLIPYNHRIFLPDLEIELNRPIKIDTEYFDRIDMAVLHLIYRKTRYMFYNSDTGTSLVVPRNLRDLLNLCSLLYGMKTIYKDKENKDDENKNKDKEDKVEDYITLIQKNRIQFRKYFIESWCYEHLDSEKYMFIQEVMSSSIENINKKIIDYLGDICEQNKVFIDRRLCHINNRVYNVSLADVDYFLDKIDCIGNKPIISYFVFALRSIYSMLLYETFEKDDIDSQYRDEQFEIRLGINKENHKNISKALRRENKLLTYSNYERLLGGELLLIENAFNRPPKSDGEQIQMVGVRDNKLVVISQRDELQVSNLIHHHNIDIGLLKQVYQYAIYQPNTLNINDVIEKTFPRDLAFNICEFFLLTTYSTKSNANYRQDKHCYYDNFPDEILWKSNPEADNIAIYNSPSILFNIVKYYNYYKQFKRLPYNNTNSFLIFWNFMSDKYFKQSLIRKMLYFNLENTQNKNEDTKFQNKNIEQIFVRNLEMLENLHDYLPYTGKQNLSQNDKIWEIITFFFNKFSEFEFYLYPKEKNGESKIVSFNVFKEVCSFFNELEKDYNETAKEYFMKIFNPIQKEDKNSTKQQAKVGNK